MVVVGVTETFSEGKKHVGESFLLPAVCVSVSGSSQKCFSAVLKVCTSSKPNRLSGFSLFLSLTEEEQSRNFQHRLTASRCVCARRFLAERGDER